MKANNERYEFGDNVLAFDVCVDGCEEMGIKNHCIHIMSGDEGDTGHKILDTIKFKNIENLILFQQGLELMQRASSEEDN